MISKHRSLKLELLKKFNHQCAYCGTKLDVSYIEHFYPKSLYPHLLESSDNLLIVCRTCDMIKGNSFPIADDGSPLLLNPLIDTYLEHIKQTENGYLEGITNRGQATIELLQLNRPALIEQRILDIIKMDFADDFILSEHEVYMTFKNNMENVMKLNGTELANDQNLRKQMAYMLYANVITALETYLCDRFISLILSNKRNLRSFVESFADYSEEKLLFSQIFIKHEEIESKAIDSMKSVLYHNLPKVSGMYRDTFGIKFPIFSEVFKSVLIRHDLVHRGGKTKDGDFHELDSDSVKSVVSLCCSLIEELEFELREAGKK